MDRLRRSLASVAGSLIGLVLVLLIFGLWEPNRFLSASAFGNVFRTNYTVAIVAVGATFIVISGGIDLSVGSTMALSCVICAMAVKGIQFPARDVGQSVALGAGAGLLAGICVMGQLLQRARPLWATTLISAGAWAAVTVVVGLAWYVLGGAKLAPMSGLGGVLVGTAVGTAVGLVNGALVTSVLLPPFIVTLATLQAIRGLAQYVANDVPVSLPTPETINGVTAAAPLNDLHYGSWLGLPPNVWIALVVVLVAVPLLHFTVLGRYTYAIGSNERTARLCGVRVGLWKLLVYGIGGATAGLAGAIVTSKYTGGQPTEFQGIELTVIAAVVIGGTSLFGGEGTILGTFLGVLMLGFLYTGCNIADISNNIQKMFIGGTIVLAAAIDRFRHMRR